VVLRGCDRDVVSPCRERLGEREQRQEMTVACS